MPTKSKTRKKSKSKTRKKSKSKTRKKSTKVLKRQTARRSLGILQYNVDQKELHSSPQVLQCIKLPDKQIIDGTKFYHPNQHCIFIINRKNTTTQNKFDAMIHKYDLHTFTYSQIMPFSVFPFSNNAINFETNTLLTTGAPFAYISIIDLNQKKLILSSEQYEAEDNYNAKHLYHPSMLYIPSPINEIHIIGNSAVYHNRKMKRITGRLSEQLSQHMRYNEQQNTFETIATFEHLGITTLNHPKMIYIQSQNTLLAMGGVYNYKHTKKSVSDCIMVCNIDNTNNSAFKWYLMDLKLPKKTCAFFATNVFDTIIVVFYRNSEGMMEDIWVLDLLNLNKQWIKCNKILPLKYVESNAFPEVKVNNYIHFYDKTKHFKVSVFDIIPKFVLNEYGTMYQKLMCGFVRIEGDYVMPFVLINLIILYYSNFKYVPKKVKIKKKQNNVNGNNVVSDQSDNINGVNIHTYKPNTRHAKRIRENYNQQIQRNYKQLEKGTIVKNGKSIDTIYLD